MQEQDAQLGWRGRKRRRNSLGSDNSGSSQESSCESQLHSTRTLDQCRFDMQEFQFKSPEEEVDFYIMLEETIMKEQAA